MKSPVEQTKYHTQFSNPSLQKELKKMNVYKEGLLKDLDLERIIHGGKIMKFKPGQVIYNRQDIAKHVYFVLEGCALVVNPKNEFTEFLIEKHEKTDVKDRILSVITKGAIFGHIEVMNKKKRVSTYVAGWKKGLTCFIINFFTFDTTIRAAIYERDSDKAELLKRSGIVGNWDQARLWNLARVMKEQKLPIGSILYKIGSKNENIFVLAKGAIEISILNDQNQNSPKSKKDEYYDKYYLSSSAPKLKRISVCTRGSLLGLEPGLVKRDQAKVVSETCLIYIIPKTVKFF